MIRNNILIIIAFLCICLSANAQSAGCNLVRKTFYYVTFDIRDKVNYPIIMNGVTKSFKIKNLNLNDKNAFIDSFYKKFFYTPDPIPSYKKMLLKCLGDSMGYIYLKKNLTLSSSISAELDKHSLKKRLLLKSGETIYLSIIKISAKFWEVHRGDPGLVKNSDEIDINDLKGIETCYVPFKVFYYKRPAIGSIY